ncbi:hypothetical protein PR048_021115 [Dryococelus australis]|uniref:Uncharacterized protein n=1 Tax=Dryococelus australis TaxID=614101 RepID=A0ABQ9GXE2_9NEOP|nr:hypothetical protein PR048_021115 [Dryococelus australis]
MVKHLNVTQNGICRIFTPRKLCQRPSQVVAITNAICKMFAVDLKPLGMVQDTDFKVLMALVEPKYSIPDQTTFIRNVVSELYNEPG